MNRFFLAAALLLSFCALAATFWLWREIRTTRLEVAASPVHHRISDERFTQIKDFVAYVHTAFDQGTVPRADVLTADGLLDKARYMHGDISREEWHRLLDESAGERMRLADARFHAGAGTFADLILLQDDVLESSR